MSSSGAPGRVERAAGLTERGPRESGGIAFGDTEATSGSRTGTSPTPDANPKRPGCGKKTRRDPGPVTVPVCRRGLRFPTPEDLRLDGARISVPERGGEPRPGGPTPPGFRPVASAVPALAA